MNSLTRRDVLPHQAHVPWPSQRQVEQDLLLCRAMAALFNDNFLRGQIAMRGGTLLHKVYLTPPSRYSEDIDLVVFGDLFDLYWALTLAKPAVNPAAIIESFRYYLELEGSQAGRAEFVGILEAHLADRGFRSDMEQLLRVGVTYDPRKAGAHVITHLLSLLPVK